MLDDVLEQVRTFAEQELLTQQDYLDSFAEAPIPLYGKLHEQGLTNWWLSRENGCLGLDLASSVDVVSELAYGDAGVAFTSYISILGTTMLSLYGGEELCSRFLAPMAANGGYCATLGSEREAGSELTRTATTVRRDGGELVLDGMKFCSTNSGFADFLVVVGRSADDPGEYLSVVVPRTNPGVHIVKRWEMIGLRASATYQVELTGARVPAGNALRVPGLRALEVGLNASRILIAATAVGIARRIRDLCMEYAETKELHGGYLIDNAVFGAKLGQMEMLIEAMKSQCHVAAREFDEIVARPDGATYFAREGVLKSALVAKLLCGQLGWQIAGVGSEMFGGLGYTRESDISKLLRDIRFVAIVEGGDDVLHELMYTRYVIPEIRRG